MSWETLGPEPGPTWSTWQRRRARSAGRSHTIMRGRCSMRDIGERKRSMRMSASSRAPYRATLRPSSSARPSRQSHSPPSERNAALSERPRSRNRRARRPPTARSCYVPMAASVFGYLCREEMGAPWPPGRRQRGWRRARKVNVRCSPEWQPRGIGTHEMCSDGVPRAVQSQCELEMLGDARHAHSAHACRVATRMRQRRAM